MYFKIFFILITLSNTQLLASCGTQSFSCPVDFTFLKEVESLSLTSQKKIQDLLEKQEFKSLLGDIKKSPISFNQKDTSSQLSVFVSFSMGEKALLNLARETKLYGATLVMRGFKDNSLKKTVAALYKIILATGQGVSTDPELFSTFKVTAVPTFVLANNSIHDRLQGHVSLSYALEVFAKEGDLKNDAQGLINKGRHP